MAAAPLKSGFIFQNFNLNTAATGVFSLFETSNQHY
jgi:hypothetical protein